MVVCLIDIGRICGILLLICMLMLHEKTCLDPNRISCSELQNVVDSCDLFQVDSKGFFFTWARHGARSYVECKLDRALVEKEGLNFWYAVAVLLYLYITWPQSFVVMFAKRFSFRF